MMIMLSSLALLASTTALPAHDRPLFSCELNNGKFVSLATDGPRLIYRYGSRDHADLVIVGSVAKRNVFFRADRFFSVEYQVRFKNGPYSYVVFSIGANPTVGASGLSGLTVMNGRKSVMDLSCRRWTELPSSPFEDRKIPEDSQAYSAL